MRSLRGRLLLWLLPATLLAGILASAATYRGALIELDEVLGDQLKVIARHVAIDTGDHLSLGGQRDDDQMSGQRSHGVLLEVWRGSTRVFSSDADARLPPPRGAGPSDMTLNGELWHSFVARDGDILVRVAQLRKARWEAVAEIAMHLFWPVLSLIPVLALFLWFGIGYGLRPLREIVLDLKRRDAHNMQPIDTATMPAEVKPLVDALNELFRRLDCAFVAQRHFVADAAHELRTPIMGIALQAELLQRVSSAEEKRMTVAQIHSGAIRLARLAEQLLTLARLAPESPPPVAREVNLVALAGSVVSDRARFAESNQIDIGLIGGDSVTVSGNVDNLRTMLNNLVDNAIRMPEGGHGSTFAYGKRATTPCLRSAITAQVSQTKSKPASGSAFIVGVAMPHPAVVWDCLSFGVSRNSIMRKRHSNAAGTAVV
ncbi:hypothetical protein BURKHO8Y_470004 [Burkholderia sp. 8Y]|nr:hypothetical protein BURKHO8Y_470004 [Burkholderia sp. 8Y]